MPTTSGGLRYPASTDAINIPLDMQRLAEDVQSYIDTNALTTTGTYTLTNKTIGSTGLFFEGATDNGFETLLTVVDPTGDNTITLPNATGTVALLTGAQTFDNSISFGTQITINGSGSGSTVIQAASAAGGTLSLPTDGGTLAVTSDLGNSEMLLIMSVFGA